METKTGQIEFGDSIMNIEVTFNLLSGHDTITTGPADNWEPECGDYLDIDEILACVDGGQVWRDRTEYQHWPSLRRKIEEIIYS